MGLARMELSKAEKESLLKDIEEILVFVDQIQEVKADLAAEGRVGAVSNIMREDGEPHETGANTQALLEEAPKKENDYVHVKKIL